MFIIANAALLPKRRHLSKLLYARLPQSKTDHLAESISNLPLSGVSGLVTFGEISICVFLRHILCSSDLEVGLMYLLVKETKDSRASRNRICS